MSKYFNVSMLILTIMMVACASNKTSQNPELDQRVKAEPTANSPEAIAHRAGQVFSSAPGLSPEQKMKLSDIYTNVYLEALSIPNATPNEFVLALDARTQSELPNLRRFNIVFEVIVGLAPLLGLLGTVTGLIASFGSLTLGDIGGSKSLNVTGGISEALISTAVGLIVAVMALIAATIFRSLYAQQIAYFDECCTQLELQHLRSHRQQAHQQVNTHV